MGIEARDTHHCQKNESDYDSMTRVLFIGGLTDCWFADGEVKPSDTQ